jgi:hypothetical protein
MQIRLDKMKEKNSARTESNEPGSKDNDLASQLFEYIEEEN